ncbi:MAG: SGNH/GDSL hydrolase family protein [Lachnospiraceae bacterium]|nr:SGNH/GDSL hydrolase family protein [Lachnospiraceae bacterium]
MKYQRPALILIMVIAALAAAQRLLMPKYMGKVIEGALIQEYYGETTAHDVVFLGDCEVYENISPITLWEDYGITSYIRGSASQMMWQSYYLLRDTLRTETPRALVLSVLAMTRPTQESEAYNRMTLDGMRWSPDKAAAIHKTKLPDERFADYVFPILRYHDRWKELTSDDLRYFFSLDTISFNGYYMRMDTKPAGTFPAARRLPDYSFDEGNMAALESIATLCRENGIRLILFKAPSLYPAWHEQWEEQVIAFAAAHGLDYVNALEQKDSIGLDFLTDTYDGGLHLNTYGAEKTAHWLGAYLSGTVGLPDHRQDAPAEPAIVAGGQVAPSPPDRRKEAALRAAWDAKAHSYEAMKAQQLDEIARYGGILRFMGE